MNRIISAFLLASFCISTVGAQSQSIAGFSDPAALRQRQLEAKFDAVLKPENLRNWMKRLSARPHHLGSAYGKQNAEFIASQFRSWGFDTKIEQFEVLFPTPKTRIVQMTAPTRFTMRLREPAVPGDASSAQQAEQLPPYNAFSTDGDVSGQLVYVNYGTPADYEELDRRGIDVRGKIVISRYGGSWRGIKPKVAAERGAVGCLIYSDPRNDGYYLGDVYPNGPYRNENGVQRGSVMDMPLHPGDPLTKGIGAVKGARRIDRKDAQTITKIPVLPISYADALPLLKQLDGAVVPDGWRGALPITYRFGGKTPTVRMKLEFNWQTKTIHNVIATMKGSELPDQWIMRGNHHDAWVNGAADPISGMVAEMEEARAFGELYKSGWRPKRTIVYAAWDAEEQGLIGSTEWVETHADELREKGAVYINTDSNGRGFLGMAGSHTLERFINDVARDVPDPQTNMTVWNRLRASQMAAGQREEVMNGRDIRIGALGSGSDYTPFLQHLGISSLNLGFGGEDGSGSYHSIYDSFEHYTRFIDTDFKYGIALAKVCGRAVMRLADAETLPFEFVNFADTVTRYSTEVQRLATTMRDDTERTNRMLTDGTWAAAQDPKDNLRVPQPKDPVPQFDFKPLDSAIAKLNDAARDLQKKSTGKLNDTERKRLNELLYKSERILMNPNGLPRRDWFRHQIYAPGFYTGYGVKTLPGIREAIEQRNWSEAREQIVITARTLERFADEIERAEKLY
jgi:N-acetylated-alpha-linked acidic dipeptidase